MSLLEDKRIFLVASDNPKKIEHYEEVIKNHIANSIVYSAQDGQDALFKIENVTPHVLILDHNLPKISGIELTKHILQTDKNDYSIILTSNLPDEEHFINEVVTGKVQFLVDIEHEGKFNMCLMRALNRLTAADDGEYRLVFLPEGEALFHEGELGKSAYIVKRGEMKAYRGEEASRVHIGDIKTGEFVGEMAHINGEARAATVISSSDCELIEIPFGTLDSILFSKPAWSKALVVTLSKRLKSSIAFIKPESNSEA